MNDVNKRIIKSFIHLTKHLGEKMVEKKKSDFIKFCEKAAEIVKTWPEWKRNLLGSK